MIDRWILALPERSAADRLGVGDVLGAAEGAERTYPLPKRVAGARRPRPDHGASLLIVSIGTDGEAPTPLRLAEVLATSIDGGAGSIKTRIGKLVGTVSLGLARSY